MAGVLWLAARQWQIQFADPDRDVLDRLFVGQRPAVKGERPVGMVDDDRPRPGPRIIQARAAQEVREPGPET
ncbi:hypothetical protein OHA21_00020 [Actinoplanes sp. NBC_00393]|uniref:hypothetical protein n=1 Tax=Actinoplanes sp. NBC_00393 TaxID=2975953 RepID=UPI002E242A39